MSDLIYNLNKGVYIINLNYNNELSLQFIAFLNSCLQYEQEFHNSSYELIVSEFITRDFSSFDFISIGNLNMLSQDYIINDHLLKFDIRD